MGPTPQGSTGSRPKVEANCGRHSERASELDPGSLHNTAINDVIRNGTTMHEVGEFAGHPEIRTTEVSFVRKEEDAEVAARRIHIRVTGRTRQ